MPSRREFLQVGFAASIFPVAAHHESAGVTHPTEVMSRSLRFLHRVVADVRFPGSAAFGLEAERLGFSVVRITGDITDFWFNDLSLRWKEEAVAIAGVTTHGPLFCLERFAWDHGLRVVFRGTPGDAHVLYGDHPLARPSETIAQPAARATHEALMSWVIAPRSESH